MSENISHEERGQAFGRGIAEALAVLGLKQVDLATALQTTQSTVSAWINARAEPDPETVFAAEAILELTPGSLSRHLGYLPLSAVGAPPDAEEAIRQSPKLDSEGRKLTLLTFRTMADMKARAMRVAGEEPTPRPAPKDAQSAATAAKAAKKTTTKKAGPPTFQAARQSPRRTPR